jgi:hypothetical protein
MLGMPKPESGCCSEEDAQDMLDAISGGDAKALALVLSRLIGDYDKAEDDDSEE